MVSTQHTGSMKDAHETILDALEKICSESGLSTQRHDIPSVRKANGKRVTETYSSRMLTLVAIGIWSSTLPTPTRRRTRRRRCLLPVVSGEASTTRCRVAPAQF